MESKSKKKSDNSNGFEIADLEELPTVPKTAEQLEREELNNAHIKSLQTQNSQNFPIDDIFGQKTPEEKLDVGTAPFSFLDEPNIKTPSSSELEQYSETDNLPIKKSDEVKKEFKNQEYFESDEIPTDANSENSESSPDNSFLSKVASLKKDILSENLDSIGLSVLYKIRSGSSGIDTLDSFTLPAIDFHKYLGLSHHIYGNVNFLNLSNGQIVSESLQRYGDMRSGGNVQSVSSIYEILLGYEYKTDKSIYGAEFGTIPKPSVATAKKNLWTLKYSTVIGNVSLDLAWATRSIKDSMLSRVGDSYSWFNTSGIDIVTTKDINESIVTGSGIRGSVTKTGVETGIKYSIGDQIFAGGLNYYYTVSGLNVLENKETSLALLYLRILDLPKTYTAMVGPIILYDNFNYNSNYFTVGADGVGNGGYFSPKNFILFGIYYDIAKIENESLFWKVKGNVGFVSFTNGPDLFDNTSSEGKVSSFGYEIKGFLGYKVDSSTEFLAGLGYQSSGTYNSLFFGLSAIYYFGDKRQVSVDDLIRSNTIGEMAK